MHPTIKSEHILRDFGYGLHYKNISVKLLRYIKFPFITVVKDNYFYTLKELSDKQNETTTEIEARPVVVIHDPRDISSLIASLIKTWKVITIRKTVQRYLEKKYGIGSLFLYHPFFPYETSSHSILSPSHQPTRKGAVSISRIGFGKNIDLILRANNILDSYSHGCDNGSDSIRIHGCPTPKYVYLYLNNNRVKKYKSNYSKDMIKDVNFSRYYYEKFERSFSAISEILSQRKFVVDLSTINNDGGGTQYVS